MLGTRDSIDIQQNKNFQYTSGDQTSEGGSVESSGTQAAGGSDSSDGGDDAGGGDDDNDDSVGAKRDTKLNKDDEHVVKLKNKKTYIKKEKKESKKISGKSKLPKENTESPSSLGFSPTVKKQEAPTHERTDTKSFDEFPQIQ